MKDKKYIEVRGGIVEKAGEKKLSSLMSILQDLVLSYCGLFGTKKGYRSKLKKNW